MHSSSQEWLMRRTIVGIAILGGLAGCNPSSAPAPATSSGTNATAVPNEPPVSPVEEVADAPSKEDAGPILPEIAPDEVESTDEPLAAEVQEEPFAVEAGFTPLSLADFVAYGGGPDTWSEEGDVIRCTGKPRGYLRSREPHQNFTWRLESRFDRPKSLKDETKFKGNTGFLVYLSGEDKLWPVCLEVQGKYVQMAAIKENGGAAPVTAQDDEAARQSARKAVGAWNRLEIVSRDGALTVNLNDVPVSRSEPNFLSAGAIGIQAEDHPFAVRRMRIKDE
jgi:hypothetical protein